MPFTVDQLAPEDQAALKEQRPDLFTPQAQAPAQTQGQSPVDLLNPTDLADLLKDPKARGGFTLEQWLSVPDNKKRFDEDPALQDKLSEAQLIHDEERFSSALEKVFPMTKPAESAGEAVGTVARGLFGPLKLAGKAIAAGAGMAKGLALYASSAAQAIPTAAGVTLAGKVGLISPELTNSWLDQVAKDQVERLAGTEAALFGLAEMGRGAVNNATDLKERTAEMAQLAATKPEERAQMEEAIFQSRKQRAKDRLLTRVTSGQAQQGISQGEGVYTKALTGGAPAAAPVDPEKVAVYAEGDPANFAIFAKALGLGHQAMKDIASAPSRAALRENLVKQGITAEKITAAEKITKEQIARAQAERATLGDMTLPEIAERQARIGMEAEAGIARAKSLQAVVEQQTAEAAQLAQQAREATIAGNIGRAVGISPEVVAAGAEKVADVAAKVGTAAKGVGLATAAGAVGAVAGAGELAGRALLRVAPKGLTPQLVNDITKGLTAVRKRAFEVAKGYGEAAGAGTTDVLGAKSQAAWDLLNLGPLTEGAKGFFALDLPLALGTAETQEQLENPALIGTFFGLAKGVMGTAKRFARGQLIDATRKWEQNAPEYTPYKVQRGPGAGLDAMTERMVKDAPADPAAAELHQRKVNRFMAIRDFVDKLSGGKKGVYWADEANYAKLASQIPGADPAMARGTTAFALPDGTIVIRDPGVAPHEATHTLQNILGEPAMRQFQAQIAKIYSGEWQQRGEALAARMGGLEAMNAGKPWELALLEKVNKPVAESGDPTEIRQTANRYLANEIHAEVLDTVIKHDGVQLIEAGQGKPFYSPERLLADTARAVVGLSRFLGQEAFEGKTSEVQKVPVKAEAVEVVRKQAQEALREGQLPPKVDATLETPKAPLVKPRAAGAPVESTPAEAREAAKALPNGPAKVAAEKAIEVIENGGEMDIVYSHAQGTPSADPASVRGLRRMEIASEPGRETSLERMIPIEANLTTGTPQILVLRRGVLDANAEKLTTWLDGLDPAKRAEVVRDYPILNDLGDQAKMDAHWEQAAHNARLGRTLAGGEFAQGWVEPGYTVPKTQPGAARPMDQKAADVLNYLFGIPQAGTPTTAPRVALKGRVPVDVAAGRLAEATAAEQGLAGRVGPEVRPAYKGKAAVREGVEGIRLQEVNPFRQLVNQAGRAPSLIEAFQRLNIADIVSAEPVATPARVNLTGPRPFPRQAGFQAPKEGVESIRSAMIVDEKTGKRYTGMMHPWIREQIAEDYLRGKLAPGRRVSEVMDASIADKANMALKNEALEFASDQVRFKEGYYTTEGRFVDRRAAMPVAREAGQLRRDVEKGRDWLDSDDLNIEASFQTPKELRDMDLEKLREIRHYTSTAKHGTGGPTGLAYDLGLATKTADGLRELAENMREQRRIYADKLAKIKSGEIDPATGFDDLQPSSLKGQLFREAAEASTGTGSAGQYLRKKGYTDADFPMLGAAFQAKTETGKAKEKEGYEFRHTGEKGIRGVVVLKDGSPVGEIISHVPQKYGGLFDGKQVWVDAVEVNKDLRGQQLGEALYRELLTTLKEDGHTEVLGMVVAPEPLALREKVAGSGATVYTVNDKPVSLEEAIAEAARYKFEGKDENGNWRTVAIGAKTTIKPGAVFQAPKEDQARYDELKAEYRSLNKQIASPDETAETRRPLKLRALEIRGEMGELERRVFPNTAFQGPGDERPRPLWGYRRDDGHHLEFDDFATKDFLPDHHAPYRKDLPAKVKIEDLAKEYKSFDRVGSTSIHDYFESLVFYKDDKGAYKMTAKELERAAKDYGDESTENFAVAYGEPEEGAAFSPPGVGVGKQFTEEALRKKWAKTQAAAAGAAESRKKATAWALKPTNDQSKAWLLPGGAPMQLGARWHHEGLKDVAERYGLDVPDFKGADAAGVREMALTKGFVRVNYSLNGGQLAIELRAADLRKQRGAIERLIEENLDKIDILNVTLFDRKAEDIVDDSTERLFNLGETDRLSTAIEMLDNMRTGSAAFQAGKQEYSAEPVDPTDDAATRGGKFWVSPHGELFPVVNHRRFAEENILGGYDGARKAGWLRVAHERTSLEEPYGERLWVEGAVRNSEQRRVLEDLSDTRDWPLEYDRGAAFQGGRFEDPAFEEEIKKIRTGKSGGQTFNPDGTLWVAPRKPVDLVSLASVNVPAGKLTKDAVREALGSYEDMLDEPGVVAGVFSFSKEGTPTVSIDVNAVVPQKYRANTLDFAKQNDQVAIWDAAAGEEVKSGGAGNTKLKSLGEIADAHQDLIAGKKVDVAEIIRQNSESDPSEQQLLGVEGAFPENVGTGRLSRMTKQEIADRYPESVVPRTRMQKIPYGITESPLYKAAGSPEAAEQAFARKLVEFANEYSDQPEWKAGLKWYEDVWPKLKKEFGKDAQFFAELLAANSPRQDPQGNFAMAIDAYHQFKAGKYDKQIAKLGEGLEKINDGSWKPWVEKRVNTTNPDEAMFLNAWVDANNLLPRQSNGKLLGINSPATMLVLGRVWLKHNRGPKTANFVLNLLGEGHEATIDVWAARTMRRLGYAGSKERWRILPKNEKGVDDPDFYFSQKAFRRAAEQLGVQPDALQGAIWFAEKLLWAKNGWGRLDLGSYAKEMEKLPAYRSSYKLRKAAAEAPKSRKKPGELDLGLGL